MIHLSQSIMTFKFCLFRHTRARDSCVTVHKIAARSFIFKLSSQISSILKQKILCNELEDLLIAKSPCSNNNNKIKKRGNMQHNGYCAVQKKKFRQYNLQIMIREMMQSADLL